MTAEDKIKEAKYNYKKLSESNNSDEEFQIVLSNFLGSCYSILQHLLEECNKKCDYNMNFVNTEKIKKRVMKDGNANVVKFIDWYSENYQKISENKNFGFLLERRRHSVHKDTTKPEITLRLQGVKVEYVDGTDLDLDASHVWRFFKENKNQNALSVCNLFLNTLITMYNDATRKF